QDAKTCLPLQDHGGSASKRLIVLTFDDSCAIDDQNALLTTNLKKFAGRFLIKCNEDYLDLVHQLKKDAPTINNQDVNELESEASIWKAGILPKYFHDKRKSHA